MTTDEHGPMPESHSTTNLDRQSGDIGGLGSSGGNSAAAMILSINELLAKKTLPRLPAYLETSFQTDSTELGIPDFLRAVIMGVCAYNAFLITDMFMMPDIFEHILIVQLAIVSPILLATAYLIHRRIIQPEISSTFALVLIFGTIISFYLQSHAPYAELLIFTVPVCLAASNVVLPLSFRTAMFFTLFCVGVSTVAVMSRTGSDSIFSGFAILTTAISGLSTLFGTYRIEQSNRRTYLFNLRETLRADLLSENNEQLKNLSETDALTQISNRRHFDTTLQQLWRAETEPVDPLALFLIDIDNFKKLNDTFGHQAGDDCLHAVAQCLQQHVMPNATLARYGGEEFVVLLPGVNEIYARSCAEVLRAAVERLEFVAADDLAPISVTISIGFASMVPTSGVSETELTKAADQALYCAKENGRNRVECAAALNDERNSDLRQKA